MARIGIGTLASVLHRVGTALGAGMDVRAIWEREAARGRLDYRRHAATVRDRLAEGDSLAEAMGACQGYFPALTVALVDVGENTGRLDDVLRGLADHYDHLGSLRRTFLTGIAWPCLQLFMALSIIGILILVMGMIGGGVDVLGFGLVGTSGFITYVLIVGVVLGSLVLSVTAVLRGWLGTAPLRMAMYVPVVGDFLRTSALSRMAWTLSLSLNSGLDARRSMKLALRSTQNNYYMSQMDIVDESILTGREFHESLRQTDLFPDEFLNSLETAEISGTHGETLGRVADEYRTRARSAAAALTATASFAIWIMVMIFLVLMILRLFMFYLGNITGALEGI